MEERLACFWELESSGLYDTIRGRSQQDAAVLQSWKKRAVVEDEHYRLPIPFKEENPRLPDAKDMVVKRLSSLAKKLKKNPDLKEQYTAGMGDLLSKGYAVEVPANEL